MRELAIIPDGGLLIVDGVIRHVGPSRRLENLAEARSALEISAVGRVVMPGFVDSSTHLIGGPAQLDDYDRRIAGGGEAAGQLEGVRAMQQATTRMLALEAQRTLKQFIRHGTTTVEASAGFGVDDASTRKILRALTTIDGKPLDVHRTFFVGGHTGFVGGHAGGLAAAADPDDLVERTCSRVLPELRRRGLARFVSVSCEKGVFTGEQVRRVLAAANDLGFRTKVHTGLFAHRDGVRIGVEAGVAGVDHLASAGAGDIALLARSPSIATLLPGPAFHLGLDHYPPARALIDAGAAVAVATGFDPHSSPTSSMPMILALACTQMRMTPAEAVIAATINGAHALRVGAQCGSLEAGKDADLIMLNAADYREIPYRFGVNLLAMNMKRGEPVFPRLGAS